MNLIEHKDEPLMIAHLCGGVNGVDFNIDDEQEIARRVAIAIKWSTQIRSQLNANRIKAVSFVPDSEF